MLRGREGSGLSKHLCSVASSFRGRDWAYLTGSWFLAAVSGGTLGPVLRV